MTPPPSSEEMKAIHQPASMERHRFHLLDALRGLAAMLVVTFHAPNQLQSRLHFPNSFLAVDFFFCLSGFVIAYSYEERLRNALTFRDFFVVRLIRLYPLFALSMIIATTRNLLSPIMFSGLHSAASVATVIVLSFLMIPNLFITGIFGDLFPLNVPAWSLFLELVANAAYAWIILWKKSRIVFPVVYLISLVILCRAVLHGLSLDLGAMRSDANYGYARLNLSFLIGVFLFRAFRRQTANRLTGPAAWLLSAATIALLLAAMTASSSWTSTGAYQLLIVAILFPLIVFLGAHCTLPPAFNPFCAFLGDMSYPLYILHVPLMIPNHNLDSIGILHRNPGVLPWLIPAYLVFLVFLSWWVGRYVDLPIRKRLTSAYKSFVRKAAVPQPAINEPSRHPGGRPS